MVNNGSPLAMLDIVNSVENILTIRDGQIRCYSKDPDSGDWAPQSVIPRMSAPAGSLGSFNVVVSNSAEGVLSDHECLRMMILNHPDNTGRIWIGGAGVTPAVGIPLEPGQVQELALSNTNAVHAIAEIDGETLIVAYMV